MQEILSQINISDQLKYWQKAAELSYVQESYFLTIIIGTVLLLIIFKANIFSFIDTDVSLLSRNKERIERFDALRAIAALCVVFHHTGCTYFYFFNDPGTWKSWHGIATTIGDYGVCIFFMLSAFLFSSKTYPSQESWVKFYIGRFFRIVPAASFSSMPYMATGMSGYLLIFNLFFYVHNRFQK